MGRETVDHSAMVPDLIRRSLRSNTGLSYVKTIGVPFSYTRKSVCNVGSAPLILQIFKNSIKGVFTKSC
jgi:hypothetical protein